MTRLRSLCLGVIFSATPIPAWPQSAQLFDSPEVLELRIATDLRGLMAERDSLELDAFPGTITYVAGGTAAGNAAAAGTTVAADAQLKLRGHWRRQRRNCDFAPMHVDFVKGARKGTIFEGQGDLRLVTHCRKGKDYQQYVLREYLVYRLYNVLTPIGLRARLVHATYIDRTARVDSSVGYAILIENERKAAARNGAGVVKAKSARWQDVDPDQGALLSAFEYLIGGTDWSLRGMHNVILFRQEESGVVWPVPYDFDWTGIVNTRYATPDRRLRIRSVRERLYRGICRTPEEWEPIVARFQAAKASLYAVYEGVPDLDPSYVKDTRKYLDDFYRAIGDAKRLKREMIDECRSE